MHLLINRFKEMGTMGNIIGIFHGDAAYLTLNDNAYNAYRHVLTGDPNKSGGGERRYIRIVQTMALQKMCESCNFFQKLCNIF